MTDQRQEVFRIASDLFGQEPDWVTFFREVLGLEGIVRRMYKDPQALAQFEQGEEYLKIQQMLAKLREKGTDSNGSPKEPTRVITVRMPKSLHETLKAEAHEKHTSMNKLCISKLLQMVDDELVPTEMMPAMAE
jgi:predicted HicB family RNase H-like nuclease